MINQKCKRQADYKATKADFLKHLELPGVLKMEYIYIFHTSWVRNLNSVCKTRNDCMAKSLLYACCYENVPKLTLVQQAGWAVGGLEDITVVSCRHWGFFGHSKKPERSEPITDLSVLIPFTSVKCPFHII